MVHQNQVGKIVPFRVQPLFQSKKRTEGPASQGAANDKGNGLRLGLIHTLLFPHHRFPTAKKREEESMEQ